MVQGHDCLVFGKLESAIEAMAQADLENDGGLSLVRLIERRDRLDEVITLKHDGD